MLSEAAVLLSMKGAMSAIGTKRTCLPWPRMSAFGGKADMIGSDRGLMTQSGHREELEPEATPNDLPEPSLVEATIGSRQIQF